jgi:hypothetical protein
MAVVAAARRRTRSDATRTRVDFGAGKQNGVALARMLKLKRPDVTILFLALPDHRVHAEGVGEFLPRSSLTFGSIPLVIFD